MRRFFLEDETGLRYDLNNRNGNRLFFHNPTGLGLTMSPSYIDLQNGFFRDVSPEAEEQGSIVGDLVFLGPEAYAAYRSFTNWIMGAGSLYLVYLPYGDTEYYRRVTVTYMTKTELTAGRWLVVPVSFACATPWYRAAPGTMEITQEAGNVLRYSFQYLPDLAYSSSRAGTMSAEIPADGHIPAAFEFSIQGPLQNPVLLLQSGVSNRIYGRCEINASLTAAQTLEISTRYGDSYVRAVSEDGTVTDLLDHVNLATDPFPRVPIGQDCFLTLLADNTVTATGRIKVYYYYRSV